MSRKSSKKKTVEELLDEMLVLENEQPHKLPGNWTWVRLGGVSLINPSKYKPVNVNDTDIASFVPMSAVSEHTGAIESMEERTYETVKKGYTSFIENDVLFAKITPCMENGKSAIAQNLINGFGFGSTEFHVLRTTKVLSNKFLYYLLRSKAFRNEAKFVMTGAVGQQRVPKGFLESYSFPLPPLPEQKRIVERVESLLGKIDESKELIERAKETFKNRRNAILEKAFKGDLTITWRNQNPSLEGPKNLFEKIKKERLEVVGSSRELKEVEEMFAEYDIEENANENGWLYLKANMFCHNINCGSTPSEHISDEDTVPFLKVYNIVNNKMDFFYKPQYIPKEIHESKLKKSKLKPNDVIMNIVGPPLKKIAIIPSDFPEWNMNQAIVRFRPTESVLPKYIYYCLQYDETLKEVINETRGVVGQSNISVSQSRNLVMPIPPIEEQQEIAKILESLLDKEEEGIESLSDNNSLELLKQSILSKAFRGELGTNNPEEESSLELLKEILQEQLNN